jgi:hypothetical protein
VTTGAPIRAARDAWRTHPRFEDVQSTQIERTSVGIKQSTHIGRLQRLQ